MNEGQINTFLLLQELLDKMQVDELLSKLFIHKGTLKRWLELKKVPDNYYNDINHLLGNKYKSRDNYRVLITISYFLSVSYYLPI